VIETGSGIERALQALYEINAMAHEQVELKHQCQIGDTYRRLARAQGDEFDVALRF
jgi:hypothetical protein